MRRARQGLQILIGTDGRMIAQVHSGKKLLFELGLLHDAQLLLPDKFHGLDMRGQLSEHCNIYTKLINCVVRLNESHSKYPEIY